jgi:hypothetical protein
MSVNPNQTNINAEETLFALAGAGGATGPTGPTGPNNVVAGVYGTTGTTQTVVIPITGLLSTSIVVATYVHPGGGGAGQFITGITEGTNQVTIGLGQNTGAGDLIQWIGKI